MIIIITMKAGNNSKKCILKKINSDTKILIMILIVIIIISIIITEIRITKTKAVVLKTITVVIITYISNSMENKETLTST